MKNEQVKKEGYKYVATDRSGAVYAYKSEPWQSDNLPIWNTDGLNIEIRRGKVELDWRNTLVEL